MTEQEIALMRSRIAELEERDENFARRSILLLEMTARSNSQGSLGGAILMGEAIARHFDVDLPLILTEGLGWITSKYAEAAEAA